MPDRLDMPRLEQRLKALASDTRLEIMRQLATREAAEEIIVPKPGMEKPECGPDEICLCKLAQRLKLAGPTISRHMAILRDAGMVTARRNGSWVFFSIHREALDDLADQIIALRALADEHARSVD